MTVPKARLAALTPPAPAAAARNPEPFFPQPAAPSGGGPPFCSQHRIAFPVANPSPCPESGKPLPPRITGSQPDHAMKPVGRLESRARPCAFLPKPAHRPGLEPIRLCRPPSSADVQSRPQDRQSPRLPFSTNISRGIRSARHRGSRVVGERLCVHLTVHPFSLAGACHGRKSDIWLRTLQSQPAFLAAGI